MCYLISHVKEKALCIPNVHADRFGDLNILFDDHKVYQAIRKVHTVRKALIFTYAIHKFIKKLDDLSEVEVSGDKADVFYNITVIKISDISVSNAVAWNNNKVNRIELR